MSFLLSYKEDEPEQKHTDDSIRFGSIWDVWCGGSIWNEFVWLSVKTSIVYRQLIRTSSSSSYIFLPSIVVDSNVNHYY